MNKINQPRHFLGLPEGELTTTNLLNQSAAESVRHQIAVTLHLVPQPIPSSMWKTEGYDSCCYAFGNDAVSLRSSKGKPTLSVGQFVELEVPEKPATDFVTGDIVRITGFFLAHANNVGISVYVGSGSRVIPLGYIKRIVPPPGTAQTDAASDGK